MRGGRERDIVPLAPFRLISLGRKLQGVRDGGSFQRQVKIHFKDGEPLGPGPCCSLFPLQGLAGEEAEIGDRRKTC